MHFLRYGLDYLHRQGGDDCLIELRWLYGRRDDAEARGDLAAWVLWGRKISQALRVGRREYRGLCVSSTRRLFQLSQAATITRHTSRQGGREKNQDSLKFWRSKA